MSKCVAIIAALPPEIGALVRGTKPDAALLHEGIHLHLLPGAVVVIAGMGAARVTLAVDAALRTGAVETLVSIGLAGGCAKESSAGDVREAAKVVDAQTGESYNTGHGDAVLVTTPSIAGIKEKARLNASYGAAMVDMEAATVARLAEARRLPFRAIKGISDAHDFEVDSLHRFTTKHGHFHTRAFALHTALRPHTWQKTIKLGRNSNRALAALAARLQQEFKLN